jgi:multidrug efflux pump subunit AcrA (membrane-fusion protein)
MENTIITTTNGLDKIDQDICIVDTKLVLKNKEYYLQQAQEMVAKYVGVIVTEDNLPDFKSTATYLKGKAKSLNDARISAVEPYSAMLKELKADCDDIINIFSSCADDISKQVKVFDEEEKTRKQLEIKNIIQEISDELGVSNINRTQVVFDEKWLNKTKKIADIKTEVTAQLQTIFAKQELRKANIITRESLIARLNNEYDQGFVADNFSIDRFSDEEVNNAYIRQHEADKKKLEARLAQEKRQAELKAIKDEQSKQEHIIMNASIEPSTTENVVISDNIVKITIGINVVNPDAEIKVALKKIMKYVSDHKLGLVVLTNGSIDE